MVAATEHCACPYCGSERNTLWATERGFKMVKCECDYLFVNPRPTAAERDKATQLGAHGAADDMDISEHYVPKKTDLYKKVFAECMPDVWASVTPLTWLDIGAGYGEVVDAVSALAPKGSKVTGLEPMRVKAAAAQKRGLNVIASYIEPSIGKFEYASLINVFSHINDFDGFLQQISSVLTDRGELLLETGVMEGLKSRNDFPGDLGLPDHVAFACTKHLRGFLERNGFEFISAHPASIDGYVYTIKNVVKKMIGRPVIVKWPYSSPYRTVRVRARKIAQ